MSPVVAVWEAAGCPEPDWSVRGRDELAPEAFPGVCALTGQPGPVYPIGKVVTGMWVGVDQLEHLHRPDAGWSKPVAWALRNRLSRQHPHALIDGTWAQLTPSDLFAALMAMTGRDVVLVPQSRQKHLLPFAEWGAVRTDDESHPWGSTERDLLGTVRALRSMGFGEAALMEPAPRWPILTKLPRPDQAWVVRHWDSLRPWRQHPALLDIACRATRKDKS